MTSQPNNLQKLIGEIGINKQGYRMEIMAVRSLDDIDVDFRDGYIRRHVTYKKFKDGAVTHSNNKSEAEKVKDRIVEAKRNKETLLYTERSHFTDNTYKLLSASGIISIEELSKLVSNGKIYSLRGIDIDNILEIQQVLQSDYYMDIELGKPKIAKLNIPTPEKQPKKPVNPRKLQVNDIDRMYSLKLIEARQYNALKDFGVSTIGQLVYGIQSNKIYKVPGIGEVSVEKLKQAINKYRHEIIFPDYDICGTKREQNIQQ
jgi:hypothetical protein